MVDGDSQGNDSSSNSSSSDNSANKAGILAFAFSRGTAVRKMLGGGIRL